MLVNARGAAGASGAQGGYWASPARRQEGPCIRDMKLGFDVGFFYTEKQQRTGDGAASEDESHSRHAEPGPGSSLNELSLKGIEAGKADWSFSTTKDSGA